MMMRPPIQSLLRSSTSALRRSATRSSNRTQHRLASTSPSYGASSWKGTFLRWGLAGGAVYYYNASSIFADEIAYPYIPQSSSLATDEPVRTLDSITSIKRSTESITPTTPKVDDAPITSGSLSDGNVAPGSPEELEAEADQQGAFNPETGEINWDCPCLGGMADGPCGEEFKAAFSCFVYSKEEPKGMECVDKFKDMQGCFRQHPEVYGAELEDDDEDMEADTRAQEQHDDVSTSLDGHESTTGNTLNHSFTADSTTQKHSSSSQSGEESAKNKTK